MDLSRRLTRMDRRPMVRQASPFPTFPNRPTLRRYGANHKRNAHQRALAGNLTRRQAEACEPGIRGVVSPGWLLRVLEISGKRNALGNPLNAASRQFFHFAQRRRSSVRGKAGKSLPQTRGLRVHSDGDGRWKAAFFSEGQCRVENTQSICFTRTSKGGTDRREAH